MRFERTCLAAFGCVLPEEVVTSAELERRLAPVYERLRLHEGRLELMTGIRERRFWEPGVLPSDGSTRAGRLALERSGVAPAGGTRCRLATDHERHAAAQVGLMGPSDAMAGYSGADGRLKIIILMSGRRGR